jgi:hypothetical protein
LPPFPGVFDNCLSAGIEPAGHRVRLEAIAKTEITSSLTKTPPLASGAASSVRGRFEFNRKNAATIAN